MINLQTQPPYLEGDPAATALADLGGARTVIVASIIAAVGANIAAVLRPPKCHDDDQVQAGACASSHVPVVASCGAGAATDQRSGTALPM